MSKKTVDTYEFSMDLVAPANRSRVEEMIPDKRFADSYTNRYVTSDLNGAKYYDFDIFEKARKLRHNVMLPGPSGAGKSTAFRAFAAHKGMPFNSTEFHGGFDFASTVGNMSVREDKTLEWLDGELTLLVPIPSILALDDVNFAPPRFVAPFFGLLDNRQSFYISATGRRVKKSPGALVMAAYNPGYLGTSQLNEAFRNRFMFTFDWGYDAGVEDQRVGAQTGTLLEMVRNMRKIDQMEDLDVGTNLMEEFILTSKAMGIGLASHTFLHHFEDSDVRAAVHDALSANLWQIADELGVSQDG